MFVGLGLFYLLPFLLVTINLTFLATNYGRGYNELRPLFFPGVADDRDMMQRYDSFIHMERFSLLFFV